MILIIAAPGSLQEGLQLLLTKLPHVEVLVAADEMAAFGAVLRHRPSLLIVDGDDFVGEIDELIRRIESRRPDTRCLVLSNQFHQRKESHDSGAVMVINKGYPAPKLLALVNEQLASRC